MLSVLLKNKLLVLFIFSIHFLCSILFNSVQILISLYLLILDLIYSSCNTQTHQMVNSEIRLIIFFAAKGGEALDSQQK